MSIRRLFPEPEVFAQRSIVNLIPGGGAASLRIPPDAILQFIPLNRNPTIWFIRCTCR